MRNSEAIPYNSFLGENNEKSNNLPIPRESEPYSLLNYINPSSEINNYQIEIPRETIHSVYGDDFDTIGVSLQNIEKNTKDYFNSVINNINKKYKEFNTNVSKHFTNVTNKITEAFKIDSLNENIKDSRRLSLIQKYSKEYLGRLHKIINMHNQILECIKETISILFNFMDISKILDKEKPIQEFLGKEFYNIIQSWMFLKLDLENFDFNEALRESHLDHNIKEFISKICKDKNFVMNIVSPKDYMTCSRRNLDRLSYNTQKKIKDQCEKNKNEMVANASNLVQLKMHNIFDVDKFFDSRVSFDKMTLLKLNNVTFTNKSNDFLKKCPNLEKLQINSTNNFDIQNLQNLSKNLIKLSLTKNGFVDFEFNTIMEKYIVNSDSIRKNLQKLSFAYNNLSNIDLSLIVCKPKQTFYALKELNLQNNNINRFSILPEFFIELKCINCCFNTFTRSYFNEYKQILCLQSGNIYLSNIDLCKNYLSTIQNKLNTLPISISYLNLSYIPKVLSNDYIMDLIINETILINLKKLDLSYNNLTDENVFTFFEHNKGCLDLKTLNLSGNRLTDQFLEKFINLKLFNSFTKLKTIDLSDNLIGSEMVNVEYNDNIPINDGLHEEIILKLRLLYLFIYENKNLSDLIITKNEIGNKFILTDNINKASSPWEYIIKDDKGEVAINCFYSLLWKIKNVLMLADDEEKKDSGRTKFNLKFDCGKVRNLNSEDFQFDKKMINFSNDNII